MQTITQSQQYQNGLKKTTDTEFEILSITSGTDDNIITAGTGKGLSFENPYITEEQVKKIQERLYGYKYLPCEVKWFGNPASESGDTVHVIDGKGTEYSAFICDQTLTLNGGFNSEVKSVGQNSTAIQFENISPTDKKIQRAYTKLQEAIAEATALINGSNGGIIKFTDSNNDGINDGLIACDGTGDVTPTTKCLVLNHEGLGLSHNGGATYENAITHEGINATAITAGEINSIKYTSVNEANTQKVEMGGEVGFATYSSSDSGSTWNKTAGITSSGRAFVQSVGNTDTEYAIIGQIDTVNSGLKMFKNGAMRLVMCPSNDGGIILFDSSGTGRIVSTSSVTELVDNNMLPCFYKDSDSAYFRLSNSTFLELTDSAISLYKNGNLVARW